MPDRRFLQAPSRWRRAIPTAIGIGAAVIMATSVAARLLIETSPRGPTDAILVFAGAPVYLQRVEHAARLYADGRAHRILLTNDGSRRRWSRPLQRNPTSVELARAALRNAGVPDSHVTVLPGPFRGTNEEALSAVEYATNHGIRSILAVTSPFHSRRAAWTLRAFARGTDLAITSAPVPIGIESPSPWTWWASAEGWTSVAPEFIKLPYYWVRFGLFGPTAPLADANARYTERETFR